MITLGGVHSYSGTNHRALRIGLLSLALLCIITLLQPNRGHPYPRALRSFSLRKSPPTWHSQNVNSSLTELVQDLWSPMLHPVTAESFTDIDGDKHYLQLPLLHSKSLGKRVCILDIDSRSLDQEGQILNDEPQKWLKFESLSAGMLGHYLYATIHGYDYRYIRSPSYSERDSRYGTWVKVVMMKEALKDYDFVVFLDSDAQFTNFELPLEWLLNYWDIHEGVMVAMAYDPDEPQNVDQFGQIFLNTGFVIAQAGKRTQEMYQAWAECPLERRYPGCASYRTEIFHEQSAFGRFLRYDYNSSDGIRSLTCADANGCPEAKERGTIGGCKGTFVRHYWHDKSLSLSGFSQVVMQAFAPRLHAQFHHLRDEFLIDARNFTLEGSEVFSMTPADLGVA